jgi:DNA-binding CsgD family transcriptional regulator
MGLSNLRFNFFPAPRLNDAVEKLYQLQVALVTEALERAVDDVGAAMVHQLRDPLTSLLLYLHEIRHALVRNDANEIISTSIHEIVDMALRETERVCEIMELVSRTIDAPVNDKATVQRKAFGPWTSSSAKDTSCVPSPRVGQQSLTPREHEVLALIAGGCSNKEGGHRLGISTRTFEAHRAHLMAKLGAKNVADLVRMALSEAQ